MSRFWPVRCSSRAGKLEPVWILPASESQVGRNDTLFYPNDTPGPIYPFYSIFTRNIPIDLVTNASIGPSTVGEFVTTTAGPGIPSILVVNTNLTSVLALNLPPFSTNGSLLLTSTEITLGCNPGLWRTIGNTS
jgi:hypothetical protein